MDEGRRQPVLQRSMWWGCLAALLLTGFGATRAQSHPSYPRESAAAMAAHHLCSGLWVVGLPRSAEEVLDQDIAPFEWFAWEEDNQYEVNYEKREVTVAAPGQVPRTARYHGDQGCTILPRGISEISFQPVPVPRRLPDPATTAWPMGDRDALDLDQEGVDYARLGKALDWAMARAEQNTRALVVVRGGRIIGERYAAGWRSSTPQISWSQGKSITAALIGVLVQQGHLHWNDPAPIAEWQGANDPRREIRIRDLLRMSSGLDFANLGLQGLDSFTRANEHMRIYFDGIHVFNHAVNQPPEVAPNTRWAYRNSDPLTLGKIVRDTVEAEGQEYLTFPQRALFDRIGARNFVLETDLWGNFIMTGYDFGSAHDWARFGLLHLWEGEWMGERILPEGWVDFISTPAPADRSQGYGGLFWLNRGGRLDRVPRDAFWSAGFMGQITMVIRSRDLVVVRLGPSSGGQTSYMNQLVGRILESLP